MKLVAGIRTTAKMTLEIAPQWTRRQYESRKRPTLPIAKGAGLNRLLLWPRARVGSDLLQIAAAAWKDTQRSKRSA